jgi:hypothetical protein
MKRNDSSAIPDNEGLRDDGEEMFVLAMETSPYVSEHILTLRERSSRGERCFSRRGGLQTRLRLCHGVRLGIDHYDTSPRA